MSRRSSSQKGNAAGWLLVLLIIALLLGGWWWVKNNGVPALPGDGPPPADDVPLTDEQEDEGPIDEPDDEPEEPDVLTDADGKIFSYLPVGDLLPSSGPGFVDETVYRADNETDILFPARDPVFLNSQVYRYGGNFGSVNGMEGGQCDARNYDYPWQDTFCEHRDRDQPLCPGGGHEGLDIRPATCVKNAHLAVAVEDGRIVDIRRHWVTLQTPSGSLYNYLHLDMSDLSVTEGKEVRKGDTIGKISNNFFKSDGTSVPTTTHLHFEMYRNYVASPGEDPLFTKVNPYMTLVAAYDRKLRGE